MSSRHHFPLFAAAILATSISSRAYVVGTNSSGNTAKWNLLTTQAGISTNVVDTGTHAIRFYLASDGFSTNNTTAELNAVRDAFNQWQAIPNTYVKFEEAGLINPPVDINTSDNTNVVYWTKSSTLVNGGRNDIGGALGVTFLSYGVPNNIIQQADIVFNGVDYNWFTDYFSGDTTDVFVEGVAQHETGHFIGLEHSPLGAATMLWDGGDGVSVQVGVSSDDMYAVRYLYPSGLTNAGALKGTITKGGSPVLGAAVFFRNSAGNTVAGTVSDTSGNYLAASLPTGSYQVRVSPLDSTNAAETMVTGPNIKSTYAKADTSFLPTTNYTATVANGVTNTLNMTVTAGTLPFHITSIRFPAPSPFSYSWAPLPTSMVVGQSNYTIGVVSKDLPTSGATLSITGDGLTLGSPTFDPNLDGIGDNFISIPISVSSNATPGPRDFIVTQGTNVVYANGFLEIQPAKPDNNFDGLDDTFQRHYFSPWTAAQAGPNADPDLDGANNYSEYIAGTDPTNPNSVLKMTGVSRTNSTATVRWQAVVGKKYQLNYRTNLKAGSWTNSGSVFTANSTNSQTTDAVGTNALRFYRVQVLP